MDTSVQTLAALDGCLEAFRRCRYVTDAVSSEVFGRQAGGFYPIGSHLRHCLEHAICFLGGIDSGCVDYDARERDESMERSPARFLEVLDTIEARLRGLDPERLRQRVEVRQTAAPDSAPVTTSSTVERELIFLSGHTIHHLAVIAMIAKEHGIDLPQELYTAYSTAAYRAGTPESR